MKVINASIDLTKIDKTQIVEGKNGSKYYNVGIIISDEKNQFGQDVSIFDQQSKEDREAKKPKKYIGNGKIVYQTEQAPVKTDSTKKDSNTELPW